MQLHVIDPLKLWCDLLLAGALYACSALQRPHVTLRLGLGSDPQRHRSHLSLKLENGKWLVCTTNSQPPSPYLSWGVSCCVGLAGCLRGSTPRAQPLTTGCSPIPSATHR